MSKRVRRSPERAAHAESADTVAVGSDVRNMNAPLSFSDADATASKARRAAASASPSNPTVTRCGEGSARTSASGESSAAMRPLSIIATRSQSASASSI